MNSGSLFGSHYIDDLAISLREWSFRSLANEAGLHLEIGHVLTSIKCKYSREHVLGAQSRIDFYLPEHKIGIEVKVAGSVNQVMRQIHRYNGHDQIDGVILITSRSRHTSIPMDLSGKPVRVVFIGGIR